MSKSFAFPLDAALRQRVRQEQVAQIALAQTLQSYSAAMQRVEELSALRAQSIPGGVAGGASFDAPERINALYYLDRCAEAIRRQHGVAEQWEQEVRRRRAELVEAAQRRRALERLRERRKQEYDLAVTRQQASQLDEIISSRQGRGASDGGPHNAY